MPGHGCLVIAHTCLHDYNHRSVGQSLGKAHQALSQHTGKPRVPETAVWRGVPCHKRSSWLVREQLHPGQELQVQKLGRKWCDGRLSGPDYEGPWREAWDRTLHEKGTGV